jgi:glyoxylase-like metal-dependent hydrolase (beta-lactamase superfamily II)
LIFTLEEIIPGIYRIPLPLTNNVELSHINVYLIRGRTGCLLVDSGWNAARAFDILKDQLDEIRVSIGEISSIVITHVHPDHYGLAGQIKQLSAADIAMHELEVPFIESRYVKMDTLLQQLSDLLIGHGVPMEVLPELREASLKMVEFVTPTAPDIVLRGGETISQDDFNFRVIPSPGHSPGHICLYEAERKILISGDHILPGITPNIGFNPQSGENPLGKYLASLEEMKSLDVSMVLPGHETPFTKYRQRIDQLIKHHRQRNETILKKLGKDARTAGDIARGMVWGKNSRKPNWEKLGPWDKRMSVLETLSHLEEMRARGLVESFSREETIYYVKTGR